MHFVTEKTLLKQVQQAKHPMARRFQWVGHRRPIPLGTPVAIQSLPAVDVGGGPTTLIETNKKKMRYRYVRAANGGAHLRARVVNKNQTDRYKNQTGLQAQLLGRGASGGGPLQSRS